MGRRIAGFGRLEGFDVKAYQQRLRILREIVAGDNQTEFAKRLGIDFKRWSNYERGYPVPREIAFLLHHKFPGMSIEWIWFGKPDSLSPEYRKRIELAMRLDNEQLEALAEMDRIKKKLDAASEKRKKALHPPAAKRSRA